MVEVPIQTTSDAPPTPKKSALLRVVVVIFFLILVAATVTLSYQNIRLKRVPPVPCRRLPCVENVTTEEPTPEPRTADTSTPPSDFPEPDYPSSEEGLLTVSRLYPLVADVKAPYFTFLVRYPAEYFVTPGNITMSFLPPLSGWGGLAPPVFIFTKGAQPLGNVTWRDVWSNEDDCLLIWSTSGFSSMEQWHSGGRGVPTQIVSQDSLMLANFSIDKRTVHYEGRTSSNVEAYVELPGTAVSYFFQTCNMNSAKDLDTMLRSFEVQAYQKEN